MSTVATTAPDASRTRIAPDDPSVGGDANVMRSGGSGHTPCAPGAGKTIALVPARGPSFGLGGPASAGGVAPAPSWEPAPSLDVASAAAIAPPSPVERPASAVASAPEPASAPAPVPAPAPAPAPVSAPAPAPDEPGPPHAAMTNTAVMPGRQRSERSGHRRLIAHKGIPDCFWRAVSCGRAGRTHVSLKAGTLASRRQRRRRPPADHRGYQAYADHRVAVLRRSRVDRNRSLHRHPQGRRGRDGRRLRGARPRHAA